MTTELHKLIAFTLVAAFALGTCVVGIAADVDVSDAVLAAQADRIATIKKISQPTIAIFDTNGQGGGSGTIISEDGYALTNYHVTAPCGSSMKVGLSDGRFVNAVLVGLDPGGDVALIKLIPKNEGEAFPVAELGNSDEARVGDWVFVAGNPFLLADNFQPTISYGILSGVHRYQYPAGTLLEYADCLQTDAAVNPGNSGGPLWNSDGQLIGVNGRCSFEKRGRVNVGVGYAISINQIKHFLSHLKSGRLVDHASLGAVVSTDSEGRVVVDDILEDSDAYRRGLRYGDEIVRFGGRDISTANAFKNVLGTYPQGWRVPLAFRRDGEEFERMVRLAGVHRDGELAELMEGGGPAKSHPEKPEAPEEKPVPGKMKQVKAKKSDSDMPESVAKYFEARPGYANHWFNRFHQQRVWNSFLARGDFAGLGTDWTIRGTDETNGEVEIELSKDCGSILMPIGKSEAEFNLSLAETLSPPRSGGLLAALHLWQRLLLIGPRQFGDVHFFGTLPWPDEKQLPDCLVGIHGGVETRFYFDPTEGDLVGVEMQAVEGEDPCEIYFSDFRHVDGRRLPFHWVVRHGDEQFTELKISEYDLGGAAAPATGATDNDKN